MAYPFLRSLPSQAAEDPGTYLVLLFTPCGFVQHLWGAECALPGAGPKPSVQGPLVLRDTLAPLESLKDRVIVVDGLNVKAADGPHEAGMGALWTAVRTSDVGLGPSIDQVVASQLNLPLPFNSIELMVRSSQDWTDREVKTRMIYRGPSVYADPFDDPVAARKALFPNAGLDKNTFIRKRVASDLNQELSSLSGKLCSEDRRQLQALQQAWNELDAQIDQTSNASAGCVAPSPVPDGYAAPSLDFPTSAKLQMDILALALACDLTRVASLQFSTATSQITHTWLGADQDQTHHDFSHRGPFSVDALGPDIYDPSNAGLYSSLPQLAAIDRFYASQVAYLGNALDKLAVGSQTLLDRSVICWSSEIDIGAAHNHNASPFLLLGGGGGRLKTNQVVRFPVQLAADPTTANVVDRSHNDLLLTLGKVMGLDLPSFGDPELCTGPISEILV